MIPYWLWGAYLAFILACLALDLSVFHRTAHTVGMREALFWTAVWVGLSLLFSVFVYFLYERRLFGSTPTLPGKEAAELYLAAFVLEKSLSIDNIFVIALIFTYFRVPGEYQHRVLFWGILGAIVMRMAFIGAGLVLIHKFAWMMYVFGAFLLLTAGKMLFSKEEAPHPEKNPMVRLARKLFPVTPTLEESRFFGRVDGRRAITPLFLVLLMVETTDIVFAVDSIPAVIGIMPYGKEADTGFIVYTSNIFAILGLRSLFFALAALMGKFRFLKYSLVVLLAFIGVKMLIHEYWKPSATLSLGIIGGILAVGVGASLLIPARAEPPAA